MAGSLMEHNVESPRFANSRPAEAGETAPPDDGPHKTATPRELLQQLANQLRSLRASRLAASDPYGTTFPGTDDAWTTGPESQTFDAQYWKDLRASMDLAQVRETVTDDVLAMIKNIDKIAAVITVVEANRWVAKRAKGKAAYYTGILDLFVQGIGKLGRLALGGNAVIKLDAWLTQVEAVQGNEAELQVAKQKFAEFMVALGLLPLAFLGGANAATKGQQGGLPAVQLPAPWTRLLPDWRRFTLTPSLVVSGGAGGGAAIDGWVGESGGASAPHELLPPDSGRHLHDNSAPVTTTPVPLATTAAPAPTSSLYAGHRKKLRQYFLDYADNRMPEGRTILLERLGTLLTKEVGMSDPLWARLSKLHPHKLASMLQTKRFLEGVSSSNAALRQYIEHLADRYASVDILTGTFEHYISTAEALLNMPEATSLERVHVGGESALHFHAVVNGQKVFLKIPKKVDEFSDIDEDLRAPRDMMSRNGARWYLLVRVRDNDLAWREAVAMEPISGRSIKALYRAMTRNEELPFPVTGAHVRGVRTFQEQARMDRFNLDDEHSGNIMATEESERPIVPVDMRRVAGSYMRPIPQYDALLEIRELAAYSQLGAKQTESSAMAIGPARPELLAADAKLKQLLATPQAKAPDARVALLSQTQKLLAELGTDASICDLLLPHLPDSKLLGLLKSEGFLEGISSSNEEVRLHTEDLAWEYGVHELPREVFERSLSQRHTIVGLPPVVGLQFEGFALDYSGMLNGRRVQVKMPPDPHADYRVDEYLLEFADKHPVLVRALHPGAKIWRRAVAWYDE